MATRRDAGRPRGKQLRNTILKATIAELAAHGIDGVSIARIAEAAEVNKTTIYRKWPTVEALVLEALRASLDEATGTIEDTGSLRGDLCGLVRQVAERMSSPTGLALTQAAFAERFNAMAKVLANTPLMRQHTALAQLVTRAAARGECDQDAGCHQDTRTQGAVVAGRLWLSCAGINEV
ncbi:MAG: TetR/AcrR family transcriptional regulator [Myxococcota bacterium]